MDLMGIQVMPFTLVHPAAILPIWKIANEHTSLSALVIGSMSPDFAYFLPTYITGELTHSIPGIFMFCVPAGMLAYAIFHLLLKRPMSVLLPDKIFARLPPDIFTGLTTRRASLRTVVTSIFLGACTHIAWDAFSYPPWADKAFDISGWISQFIGGHRIATHDILQYVSSVLGLFFLCISISHWMNDEHLMKSRHRVQNLPIWLRLIVAIFVLSATGLGALIGGAPISAGLFELFLFHTFVGGLTGAGFSLGIFCMAWHAYFLSQRCLCASRTLSARDKIR
jgi:hypothetical protein